MNKISAAMYLRKSRAEEGESIDEVLARHKSTLKQFAQNNNITIVAEYNEVVSGESLSARPQMLKLLDEIYKYDAVLCMDIDRLSRGAMKDQGVILETLANSRAKVITPEKTYDLTNDLDDSLVSFKALFAREEYKIIRARLMRGKRKVIQEGGYVSNAPFGYVRVRKGKLPSLEIVSDEAVAVRLMFDMYINGDGCQRIADAVNAMGLKPHRAAKFGRSSIAAILRNPTYTGKTAWNRCTYKSVKNSSGSKIKSTNPPDEWLLFDGVHEPIIEQNVFDTANAILTGRYHPPYSKPNEVANPFAGILVCGECGRSMVRMPFYRKQYQNPVIGCPTTGCQMSTRQDIVEQLVFTLLTAVKSELTADAPENVLIPDNNEALRIAEAERIKLQSQLEGLHDFLERGIYDAETFLERKENLTTRIIAINKEIKALSKPISSHIKIHKRIDSVIDLYWDGTPTERNNLLKSIVGKIRYTKPKGSKWGTLPSLALVEWSELP